MSRPRVILNEVIVNNLQIQDEGVNVGNSRPTTIDFVGSAVTATRDGNVVTVEINGGGAGTVTSFSASDLSPLFTTSEANPTTTPALSFTIAQHNGNKFIASPANGSLGDLSARAIVSADIPDLSATYYLASNPAGYGTGTVTNVSGTVDRITSTGGATPVIDIAASYAGQSSIVTVGTLTSGATGTGFTIALGTSTLTGDLPFANLTQGSARSVLGVTGNGAADFASIQGTTDQVLRVDGAGTGLSFGSIDLSKSATVGTSILPVANGGTSFSSYTTGDLIQASAAGTLAKLNSVATGNVLISGGVGTVSSWGKVTSSHIDATVQTAGLSWLLTGTSTLTGSTTIDGAQTLTFANTTTDFTGTRSRFNSGNLAIWNAAKTFIYMFTGGPIAADRTVVLPTFTTSSNLLGGATTDMATGRIPFLSGATGLITTSANITYTTNRLSPSYVTLAAGTATAGTAPLVMTSGTNLTTAISGAVEYNNTFHMTNSDATRRHVVLAPNTTKVTAGAPYANDGYIVMNIGGTDFKIMTTA